MRRMPRPAPITPSAGARPRTAFLAPRAAVTAIACSLAAATVAAPGADAADAAAVGRVVNASFEGGWSSSSPARCWQQGGVGSGTATLQASGTAFDGTRAARLAVRTLARGGNRKVVIDQHTSDCAPTVVPGHRYTVSLRYRSSARPQMVVYFRDGAGRWHWWDEGSQYAARSSWGRMAFTTAPVPPGATALSFGSSVTRVGWLLVDSAEMVDRSSAPAPAPTPTPTPTPTSTPTPAPSTPTPSGDATSTVKVSTAAQLTSALKAATPGTTIALADGTYPGRFTLARSGTAAAPIRITGGRGAVLDGGSTSTGYVLHLDRADHVRVDGFTVRNGQKAVVLDESNHVVLDDLDLGRTGSEVVLLRNFSSDNVVSNSEIHDAGLVTPGYGEGVYVGLAKSNWSSTGQSRTGGAPDASNRNQIVGNHVFATAAENVDIKEGTTGGTITGNTFDATGMSGANYADSWVDIAGNGYLTKGNTGLNPGSALLDGYQTHVQLAGWGNDNVFDANASQVDAPGYAVNIHTKGTGNVVTATNTVSGAGKGLTNVRVTQ